jgi:glycosyltransferase involved in cell wall biosynthesis
MNKMLNGEYLSNKNVNSAAVIRDSDSSPPSGRKLCILMIAPEPWFQPRGTPFSVLHRIKAISSMGHSVDLVTYPIGNDIPVDNLTIYRAVKIPFIKKVGIGPSVVKVLLDIALFLRASRLLKNNRYDLIHTHEEASFFGAYLAKKNGIPHLYDMHSYLPQQLRNFRYTDSVLIRRIFEKFENYAIRNSDAVITICPELQNLVKQRYPEKTSLLIENVADNRLIFSSPSLSSDELKNRYHLNGKKIVLYYGTFEPYQGLDLLIESAASVVSNGSTPVQFLVVGGNEKQIRYFRKMVGALQLGDYFTFTGFVQPDVIPEFIDLCDILVSPRLRGNNSPLKIYSYLRSGKPIVATRHITHTQILDDSVAKLVEPTPEDFAAGIKSVLADPQKSEEMVKAASSLARKRYSYDGYLRKTQWILHRAVNGK